MIGVETVEVFDYDRIPSGYYDRILEEGNPVQMAWHRQKFERVRRELELADTESLLDVGCGPGPFLGRYFSSDRSGELVGIDIAPEQIAYANQRYGGGARRFVLLERGGPWPLARGSFSAASAIEVIEHLPAAQITELFDRLAAVLRPGARVVITTPNYFSHWPLLEWLVGVLSPVSYDEQHISRFRRPTVRRHLGRLTGRKFQIELVATSHFVGPFLSSIHADLADRLAEASSRSFGWWPFGALLVVRLRFTG